MSRWYCPVCGDASAVYPGDKDDPASTPLFRCNRGHRGVWEPNGRSARPAEWTMPDPAAVAEAVRQAKGRIA